MEKVIYTNEQTKLDSQKLDFILCSNIARNNPAFLEIIKKYHMNSIKKIRNYMMNILGGHLVDPHMLNACFYSSLKDLGISIESLMIPQVLPEEKEEKVVSMLSA